MIKKILISFLLLLFCWAIYLMQIDPEAEAFFYSYPEQEKKEIDLEINSWLNNKTVEIPIVGDVDTFNCWNWNLKESKETCAPNEELLGIITQNKVLFDKYQLYKKDPKKSESLSGQTLINGHRLLLIKIYLMIFEKQYEKALSLLVDDNEFWKKTLISGASGWVDYAIYMVHLGLNTGAVHDILNTPRKLDETEYKLLSVLLSPINMEDLNVEKIVRTEFEMVKVAIPELQKDNHQIASRFLGPYINHAYKNAQYILNNSTLSSAESCAEISSIEPRGEYNLLSFITSFIIFGPDGFLANSLHLSASPKSTLKLLNTIQEHSERRKLLSFIVLLKEKNIPSSQISAFIKDHPDLATNPLTGNLFIYDQQEKKISIDATECSEPWSISLSNFN